MGNYFHYIGNLVVTPATHLTNTHPWEPKQPFFETTTAKNHSEASDDELLAIFTLLGPLDICRVSIVCKRWYNVCQYKVLWKTFCKQSKYYAHYKIYDNADGDGPEDGVYSWKLEYAARARNPIKLASTVEFQRSGKLQTPVDPEELCFWTFEDGCIFQSGHQDLPHVVIEQLKKCISELEIQGLKVNGAIFITNGSGSCSIRKVANGKVYFVTTSELWPKGYEAPSFATFDSSRKFQQAFLTKGGTCLLCMKDNIMDMLI